MGRQVIKGRNHGSRGRFGGSRFGVAQPVPGYAGGMGPSVWGSLGSVFSEFGLPKPANRAGGAGSVPRWTTAPKVLVRGLWSARNRDGQGCLRSAILRRRE